MTIAINHPVKLYGQPTSMTCWSAAATMVLGSNACIGPGSGTLTASGGLIPASVPDFARSLGLQVEYPQCWTLEGLADLLETGPLWVAGAMPTGHVVVVGSMNGDGTPDGTELTLYDPWPPGAGRVRRVRYGPFLHQYPLATMYIIHR
jgi:hypothetical protein